MTGGFITFDHDPPEVAAAYDFALAARAAGDVAVYNARLADIEAALSRNRSPPSAPSRSDRAALPRRRRHLDRPRRRLAPRAQPDPPSGEVAPLSAERTSRQRETRA